jgi:HK97 family phage major capsid protein
MTPEEQALQAELTKFKSDLEAAITTKASAESKAEIEKQIKALEQKLADAEKARTDKLTPEIKALNDKVKALEEAKVLADERDKKNQEVIDNFLADKKKRDENAKKNKKSFGEAMHEELANQFESKQKEIQNFAKDRNAKLSFELKTVGDMTIPVNLTGQGVATFNSNVGLVPNQKVNMRDLIPTTISPTGIYVSYRETGGEGGITTQVEGAAKSQKDYDLARVETVSGYISGYVRFSKQMMYVLPWLQTSLVRMLLRDFYKEENRKFYAAIALAATGFSTTAETDDNKAIIDLLYGRADQDFNNSFILGKNNMVGRMLKLMYGNGYYSGAGSVVGTPNGQVSISGIPVIGASFATSDKVMIIDSDYIERVETESLRVDFSYEDADNFTKNLVTARVECFEDLNLLRTDAHSLLDLGNS